MDDLNLMQRLSRPFAIENEIKEAEDITLVDKNGGNWPSYVASGDGQGGKYYLAKGWRSFCAANRLKTGETFTLEFVRGEGTTPMLKFCSKSKDKVKNQLAYQVNFCVKMSCIEFFFNELYFR